MDAAHFVIYGTIRIFLPIDIGSIKRVIACDPNNMSAIKGNRNIQQKVNGLITYAQVACQNQYIAFRWQTRDLIRLFFVEFRMEI